MATQPKAPQSGGNRIQADARRITRLSETLALSEGQRWLAREKSWVNEKHLELCRIPAPTFFERQRAEWFRDQLQALNWHAELDAAGNVLAAFKSPERKAAIVLSAHLDTVFAPRRMEDVYAAPDGRLIGPGVADNGPGLSALLTFARLFSENSGLHSIANSLLIVANVGEEGEGNLSGMRHLFGRQTGIGDVDSIKAVIVLDGPSTDHVTTQALASRRFELNFAGPGGHSWNDYGTPNPVHALADAIAGFIQAAEGRAGAGKTLCSYSCGVIEGGITINSIPASARAKLDMRSDDSVVLDELAALLTSAVERGLEHENRVARLGKLSAKIKELGSRPGGRLPDDSPLLRTIQAVDSVLGIRSRVNCASTDANVPLSMGLPAVAIGAGGQGGGAHTDHEWFQPDSRDLGLRRVLLLLAALLHEEIPSEPVRSPEA